MDKLKGMTEFVLQIAEQKSWKSWPFKIIERYANFLSQPLQLGFFVPCDEQGNVLEEPKPYVWTFAENGNELAESECKAYQAAKERVLFEGFITITGNGELAVQREGSSFITASSMSGMTIERLVPRNLPLTESAKKKINSKIN